MVNFLSLNIKDIEKGKRCIELDKIFLNGVKYNSNSYSCKNPSKWIAVWEKN